MNAALCLVAVLTLEMGALAGDIKLPGTPAGTYLAEYLRACNARDQARLTKFAGERLMIRDVSVAEWTRLKMGECDETGGHDVHAITRSDSNRLTALLETRITEDWFRVEVEVAPEQPRKIATLHYFVSTMPPDAVRRGMTDQQIVAELKAYMDKLDAGDRFSGVVLVAKDGQPIFEHAYGMADQGSHRRNTMDSIFTIGSAGKMFTAVALAQLVEQGKMSYQDTVGKFLAEYPNKQVRDKVTIGELLSHASGLGDFLERRTAGMMNTGVKRAVEYLPLFQNDPLQSEPGARWSYSNAGLALAGAILETVSGESYFDYVRKHVFAPAGMASSDPNETRAVPTLMVTPYTHRDGVKWNDREPAGRDIGSPAGGCYSTAHDLLRFAEALRANKLVSRRVFEQLVSPHSKTPRGTDYGYGFEIYPKANGRRVVGHGGGTVGVNANFTMFLDQGYTAIMLQNYENNVAAAVKLRAMILGR